ncbi:hypothetical protein [Burkholderia stagnalis]|uniref:hypothetical protein n=1 Tax=Burkholderia stagnalis TaxID=1503054 RepID=UPI000F583F1E|nr:hypothetical protein [Burkholderia stagnalis]RQQ37073.1 hypothetical protein DF163_01510 [Burkholderia stagnalis]RQQ55640.1 hypothetical protein DF162_01685 [Burkholderia stagnalis]RQY19101.1 hypothetical protein DF118_01690 [Burkholderia stagnalis]RQY64214.1 hypothetical protein DF112_00520 [Burkholderia stagnalis]RQY70401.1 hypothetical protein DF109_02340 [Burkholderia stagnalis]
MTAAFDREKAAHLCDELAAELAKLDSEPRSIQEAGGCLTMTKFLMEPMARNLRSGLYDCLVAGAERPNWMKD